MSTYQILFSKRAQKDVEQLTAKQKAKLKNILLNVVA